MTYKENIKKILKLNQILLIEDQIDKILLFLDLILEWNSKINLTAHREIESLIEKDIIDSLYFNMYMIMYVQNPVNCLDLGSGAGVTGIIVSIMNPETQVAFLDSDRKKINFVRQVCRELKLKNNLFLHQRAEDFLPDLKEKFAVSVSRATWKIEDYLQIVPYYVQNNGTIFFMAGKNQENTSSEILNLQGLERGEEIFYKIHPKSYDRKIFFFRKIERIVPRETV